MSMTQNKTEREIDGRMNTDELVDVVCMLVSEHENVSVEEMMHTQDTPLYEVIDIEAVQKLLQGTVDMRLEFEHSKSTVVITNTKITVTT